MFSERRYKVTPTVPILRRGDIWVVPKGLESMASRQLIGHETDLDERPYSGGEQSVVDLVNVREVVNRMPLAVFGIDADFVVKNGMKANVVEVRDLLHRTQVAAIVFTQAQNRASRAKHLFPKVGEGMRSRLVVDDD